MCLGGQGFNSCQGFRIFFVPRSCRVDQFIFHILTWPLNAGNLIFIYLNFKTIPEEDAPTVDLLQQSASFRVHTK